MMRGWRDFAEGQLLLAVIFSFLVFLIIMAAEFLHYVSDGAIPQLVEWQPAQKREINAPYPQVKYFGEEGEEDVDLSVEAEEPFSAP